MSTSVVIQWQALLSALYGAEKGATVGQDLRALVASYRSRIDQLPGHHLDQRSTILITYGDIVREPERPPLQSLRSLLSAYLSGVVDDVHLLPFFPYSSDDGFSVIDYQAVDPALGEWADVTRIGEQFGLMFDLVINHISAESDWFQAYRRAESPYDSYFVEVSDNGALDLSEVFRPRALPLLTEVETVNGPRSVWTTFSDDQIDLNFANPDVLLAMIDVLLSYVTRGASLIRLDAVAFIWKEPGTPCVHLPQAHWIVQLFRAVLDEVAPHVALITETNVPHRDNISYFGDGTNEAQMVYNFSLPPLTLHTFHTGDATALTAWATQLDAPSPDVAFFNFLASHDGIGVTPVRDILSEAEIDALARRVVALGGHVSNRRQPDGSDAAYELNINFLDALGNPERGIEPNALVAQRFLASQAIMLALRGVPGIYFHSLFGSRGWPEGVAETGRARSVNREKLALAALEQELADPQSLRHMVFHGYRHMLLARRSTPAFDPAGEQHVLPLYQSVFALTRTAPDGDHRVLCLHNVTEYPVELTVPARYLPSVEMVDMLARRRYVAEPDLGIALPPYGVVWLAPVAQVV